MQDRFCIVVDERDQQATLKQVQQRLRQEGYALHYEQINVKQAKYHGADENGQIYVDNEKILTAVQAVDFFKNCHVIAVDYNLIDDIQGIKDTGLNGFDVILGIRRRGYSPKRKMILYSSGLENAIRNILSRSESLSDKDIVGYLKKLYNANISFQKRDDGYPDELIRLIRGGSTTLDEMFLEKMREYNEFRTEYFDGLYIYDLEELLESKEHRANQFKKELIDQFVAYLILFNES